MVMTKKKKMMMMMRRIVRQKKTEGRTREKSKSRRRKTTRFRTPTRMQQNVNLETKGTRHRATKKKTTKRTILSLYFSLSFFSSSSFLSLSLSLCVCASLPLLPFIHSAVEMMCMQQHSHICMRHAPTARRPPLAARRRLTKRSFLRDDATHFGTFSAYSQPW